MKKILVFAPKSPHTAKFIDMIEGKVDYYLVASNTALPVHFKRPYTIINQHSIKGILTIIRFLWGSKHDYIHVHSINFTALIVSLFALKPIIITAWGSDVLLLPNYNILYRTIIKFILRRANIVTANSAVTMKQAIHSLIPTLTVKDVHFGVSPFSKRTPFLDKENIIYSPRGHALLYNIDRIIEAFRVFSSLYPGWKLVIAGASDPLNTPKLKAQSTGLPVIFTGFLSQEENAQWNARAKIVVSIPSSDALSVSLMEAIYSNCICFVSALTPNTSVITDGINGFIEDLNFSRYSEIQPQVLEERNKEISQKWSFDYNQKIFLGLYQ
jgi:L-malate glycosyltransferase